MDRAPHDPTNERPDEPRSRTRAALTICAALALSACAGNGAGSGWNHPGTAIDADGRPSGASLQRIANSALSTGNARVRFVDGVAYVTGNVQTAIDANAVARALRNVEGVDRVELQVRRNM